jgi:type VI secretion system protein ImpL
MPELQTLRRFVDRMKELEGHLNEYNIVATPDSGDLQTVGRLVKYVYGTELPQSFYQNGDFYLRALKSSRQDVISLGMLKAEVAEKQDELAQKFFDALLERELPIAQLDELQAELDMLSKEPTTADSDSDAYRALMGTIDQLNIVFMRPELAWLGKMSFDPGPEFTQLLDSMQMSMLFGPDARMKLQEKAAANFDLMRNTLQNY